mgnify:CR=1 FL=1
MKHCNKCHQDKPLHEFYDFKGTKDGKRNGCKSCWQLYRDQNKHLKHQHYLNNKNEIISKIKEYELKNKDKMRLYRTNYTRERLKNDAKYKIAFILRTRLRQALKNHWKSGSAVKDLGCSIQELKVYLESKFQPGMTWDNHGKWHIDHIIPLSAFDLTNRTEFLKACHYSNLRPLWALDNIKKSNKLVMVDIINPDID